MGALTDVVYYSQRPIYTDRYNSMWHFILGVLSGWFPIIIPIFVSYQLWDWDDANLYIDLTEFLVGLILAATIQLLFLKTKLPFLYPILNLIRVITK